MEVLGASISQKFMAAPILYRLHRVSTMIGTAFLDGVEEEVTSEELKTADWDAIRVYKRGMYNDCWLLLAWDGDVARRIDMFQAESTPSQEPLPFGAERRTIRLC